ncbi:MAG: hypothetical protein ACTTJC_04975 [Campylobacter sp.]
MKSKIKFKFLSFFREFFIYHHRSLEFRAKVFAAIIAAKLNPDEEDFENLYEISNEIYKNDENRKRVLIQTTREYVSRVKKKDPITLDSLLLVIDQSIKSNKRYASKIDFEHLRRLMDSNEEESLIQQRVYDFLLYEVKTYAPNR